MRLTLRADGAADLDLVWQRYSVPELWSTWAPQIRRVECSAERLAVGVTGMVFGVILDHRSEARIGGGTSTALEVDGPAAAVMTYAPVARISLESLVRPPKK